MQSDVRWTSVRFGGVYVLRFTYYSKQKLTDGDDNKGKKRKRSELHHGSTTRQITLLKLKKQEVW